MFVILALILLLLAAFCFGRAGRPVRKLNPVIVSLEDRRSQSAIASSPFVNLNVRLSPAAPAPLRGELLCNLSSKAQVNTKLGATFTGRAQNGVKAPQSFPGGPLALSAAPKPLAGHTAENGGTVSHSGAASDKLTTSLIDPAVWDQINLQVGMMDRVGSSVTPIRPRVQPPGNNDM
jgi:hypothetical protein